ncbi:MAG: HAMP domain-containing protein, partial [Candidatus Poribacteria bacterium]
MFYAKKIRNFLKSIAFQLTAWYVIIFAISSAVVFIIFYIMTIDSVHRRTDISLLKKAEEMRVLLSSNGLEALKGEMTREAIAQGTETTFYRLITGKGEVLASSDISAWRGVDVDREIISVALSGEPVFKTIQALKSKHHHRKARLLYTRLADGVVLQIGFSLIDEAKLLESFREVFGTAMLIMLIIAGLGGWFLAHRALGRVAGITAVAQKISRGSLDSRVPLTGTGDEIDQLALTFNDMLDHIQKLVTEMREVTDNIAHDLKSPITRMRGGAEVVLMQERTLQEYQDELAEIISECDRLLSLINITLDISE